MHILLKRFLTIVSVVCSSWVIGLAIYLIIIPTPKNLPSKLEHVDAVVILTGDYLRLEKGVEVFLNSNAEKLLISGVPRKISKKSVLRRIKSLVKKDLNPESVYLGHIADSTISNATEAKIFMDLNGYKSMYLVTSNYHIPRSLYLFKRAMPGYEIHYRAAGLKKIELIKTKWRYLITEYHKLIGTIGLNIYDDLSHLYYMAIVKTAAFINSHI